MVLKKALRFFTDPFWDIWSLLCGGFTIGIESKRASRTPPSDLQHLEEADLQ